MRVTGTRAMGIALVLATGCAQNAYFELQVQLPPNPPGETWFAQVQVRPEAGYDFAETWMGGDVPTVPLGAGSQWDCISVQSLDSSMSLHVRVRFCRAADCLDLDDVDSPQRLYIFETPFYIGSRTYYRVVVPSVPTCSDTLPSCDVGVCDGERCGCLTDSDCGAGGLCEADLGCVQVIGRCAIEGCIEGPATNYCHETTGPHFCEGSPDVERDDTFMCPIAD